MVPHNPRARSAAIASYVAPAVLRSITSAVTSRVLSSLPSFEDAGKAAGQLYKGYKNSSPASKPPTRFIMDSAAAPVAIGTRVVKRRAKISSSRGRGKPTTISNREMITGGIAGSSTFTLQYTYPLNPGMSSTFPWLSTQASQYEEYRFKKLIFEFVPIAPTSTQGDIILAPDYDSSNPPPLLETQAVDHYGSVIDSVWKPVSVRLNVADMHSLGPRKYVRTSNVYGDIKTFDCGNMYMCTNNETGTTVIGKLFVDYTVDLFTPTNGPANYSTSVGTSSFGNSLSQTLATGVAKNLDIPSTFCNALGITVSGATGSNVMTFPPGFYRVDFSATVSDTSSETFSCLLVLQQNGSIVTAQSQGNLKVTSLATGQYLVTGVGYVSCSSITTSQAISIYIDLVGAAGTLSVIADSVVVNVALA